MWLDYNKERFGYESIEEEWGFLLFSVAHPHIYVQELYVKPECRGKKHAVKMVDQLALIGRERNCTHLTVQVWTNDRGASRTLQAGLAYGLKVIDASGGRIILTKEI